MSALGFHVPVLRPHGRRRRGAGGGGATKGDDSGAQNVHLTTIRTLDIRLAILLQTLASAPDCPKVGSIDFGERLTVVFGERSVSWMFRSHRVHIGRSSLPGQPLTTPRGAALGTERGTQDWCLCKFDVLRARKRSSERMHIALRMRMTTGGGVSPWRVCSCAEPAWTDRRGSR